MELKSRHEWQVTLVLVVFDGGNIGCLGVQPSVAQQVELIFTDILGLLRLAILLQSLEAPHVRKNKVTCAASVIMVSVSVEMH